MDLRFHDIEPSPEERAAVDALLGPEASDPGDDELRVMRGGARLRTQRHLLLPALHAVQSALGWISQGALDYVCRRLAVPPAEAYGVASFYALFALEQRAPRVAHVCDDVGCRSFGAEQLIEALEAEIGPEGVANADGTWLRSPCLGQCDRAPAVYYQLAAADDGASGEVTAAEIVSVLDGSAAPDPGDPAVPQAPDPALRVLRRVGVADPTSLDSYVATGGFASLVKALEMGPEHVLSEVKLSGLRGRGGAAFPTGIKWEAVATAVDKTRYVICNADESEPGTFKDRVLMEGDPFAVVESMAIAGIAVGAEKGFIYIRGEYPTAEERVRDAIGAASSAGYLGSDVAGSGLRFELEIRRGAGAYICGEETALMNSIEGLRGEPRNKPPFPTQVGLFGKPTVINNVETLVNVLDIVLKGGEAYSAIGTERSTGTRLFCLSGAVSVPGVYEIEMGATLGDLLDLSGGVRNGDRLLAMLLGGAAGSFVDASLLDLPLTFEDATARGVSLGSGVVMVFSAAADIAAELRRIAAFFRDESCGQCVPCRVGTVRQEELLAKHLVSGEPLDRPLLDEIARVMKDASICGLGHTASGAIESAIDLGLVGAT